MLDPAFFQIVIAFTGVGFVFFFLDDFESEKSTSIETKLVGALFMYTLSLFSLLIPATTRQAYNLFGLYVPPIQIWIEAFTMGFLISAAWDVLIRKEVD